jgi:hypothetical protein
MLTDPGLVVQGGNHEQIGSTTSANEMPGDFLSVSHHVLGRGRFVVDIAGVDVGPGLKEKLGDFDGAREVERCLTVTATRMHQIGLTGQQLAQCVDPPESGSGVGVDGGAALNGVVRKFGRATVQKTEPAGPPPAAGVNICTGLEQGVQYFRSFRVDDGRRVERPYRFVDFRPQLWVLGEVGADETGIILAECFLQLFNRFGWHETFG